MNENILVVEDETHIAQLVERGLRASGFDPQTVGTGGEALTAIRRTAPDLVVLDIGLPDMDGLCVLRSVRDAGVKVPVILLTARSSIRDKVQGFDGGADDYMTKPFTVDELVARVRARLRSAQRGTDELVLGDVHLDLRSRRVRTPDHGEIELSAREFTLLEDLMRHGGALRTREQLLSRVWGFDFDPGSNVVEVYVGYLRKKVGGSRIQTVRGAGYRMSAPPPS